MAAHVMYHNDMLPNKYPPPRPTLRGHGITSEYEAPVIMERSIPCPQVDGGIGDITFDDDNYPTITAPRKTSQHVVDLSEWCDPSLCLTPEKANLKNTRTIKLNRGSDEGLSTRPQHSQKVRFDNLVEVKDMSPKSKTSLDGSKSANDSERLGTVVESAEQEVETDSSNVSHQMSDNVSSRSMISRFPPSEDVEIVSVHATDFDFNEKPTKTSNSTKSLKTKESSKIISASKVYSTSSSTKVRDSTSATMPSEHIPESALARPEFNSTLRVGRELQHLSVSEIDVPTAVKQKLDKSERLKAAISDKVTSRLNQPSAVFGDLPSVAVQEEELIDALQREKTARAKPRTAAKTARPENHLVSPPDILDCLTPDLMRETASLTLDGLPPENTGPCTVPLERAFDVYRHIRTWENC